MLRHILHKQSLTCSLVFFAILLVNILIVSGQTKDDAEFLNGFEEVIKEPDLFQVLEETKVYVSTRTLLELKKTPGSVFVISSEEIERLPVFTVPDVLRLVPGVHVTSTAMGERVTIRGFGDFPFSDKILFLIDGVPWNSPDKGGGPGLPHWDLFPIEQIKQIEVVKGPGSVLFGKNAFWGVINIVTKRAVDTKGIKTTFVNGQRDHIEGSVQYGGVFKDLEWSFFGKAYTRQGSIDLLEDVEEEVKKGYLNLRYKDFFGSLYFENYNQDRFFFSSLNSDGDFGAPDIDFDTLGMRQNIANIHLEYKKDFTENFTGTTRFSFQYRRGRTCSACHFANGIWGSRSDIADEEETNRRFFLSQQIDYDFGNTRFGKHLVSGGFEAWYDTVRRDVSELGVLAPTIDPDGIPFTIDENINGGGVFIQDQWSVLNDKLNFTFGVRAENHDKSGDSFTKRVSVVAFPTNKLTLRASFSDAFKSPNWNDMYLHNFIDPAVSSPLDPIGFDILGGGPRLEDEEILMIEAGIEYQFTPNLSVRVDGYYTEVDDMIFPINNPADFGQGIFTLQSNNADGIARIKGGEFELMYKFNKDYTMRFGYDYQWTTGLPQNQKDFFGRDIGPSYAPVHKIHAMLFAHPLENLDLSLSYVWIDEFWPQGHIYFHPSDPATGKYSSYGLLDAKISYKLPAIKNTNGRIFLTGENLLNEQVPQYVHDHDVNPTDGQSNNMIGRRFSWGIEWKF